MTWRQHIAFPLVFCVIVLAGCGTPQNTSSTAEHSPTNSESWESISNRWGSLPVKAIKRAAGHGDASGELYLGWVYWSGQGTATNHDEAIKWFKRAAGDGLAAAQNRLGWHYLHGVGLKVDYEQALLWFRKAADQGYANAEYNLGTMYYSGNGVSRDYSEALNHFQHAAEKGNALAQCSLGYLYREGLGTSKDDRESVRWYRKSADQEVAEAQKNLGDAYRTGKGVLQDYEEAAKLYRLAAEQGDAKAQNNLGWLYQKGMGVPTDPVEAVKWYQKAADQGETHGAYNLAWIYAAGVYGPGKPSGQGAEAQVRTGGVAPNHGWAEKWLSKAVDLNTADGQYQMGYLLISEFDDHGVHQDSNYPVAAEYFRKAAEQGNGEAQYELAKLYFYSKLGPTARTNCIPWYLKSAAQGNVKAQSQLGEVMQEFRDNALIKSGAVIEYLRRSAEAGDVKAQFQLAKRYQSGDGVKKDAGEAFKWMRMASEYTGGDSSRVNDALYEVGLMYQNGDGVAASQAEARSYILRAAEGLQPNACYLVGQMLEKGDGVPQDDYAAARNYFDAMFNMGGGDFRFDATEGLLRLYAAGRGTSRSDQDPDTYEDSRLANKPKLLKEIEWLIRSPKAKLYLGEIYYQGKIVPKDLVEAAVWLDRADREKADGAMALLQQAEREMSPAQVKAANLRYYVRTRRDAL